MQGEKFGEEIYAELFICLPMVHSKKNPNFICNSFCSSYLCFHLHKGICSLEHIDIPDHKIGLCRCSLYWLEEWKEKCQKLYSFYELLALGPFTYNVHSKVEFLNLLFHKTWKNRQEYVEKSYKISKGRTSKKIPINSNF